MLAGDPAAAAQIDLIVGPRSWTGRLIRESAAGIVVEDGGIFAAVVAALPVMGCLDTPPLRASS